MTDSYKEHHNPSSLNNWLSWISCCEREALDTFSALCYADISDRTWKQHHKHSSTVVKIWDFRKPGGLAITTDFMWKALRFFSCFPNSLPESVVAFSVVKLLQDVIWIFIVISILCLDKEKPVSLKKKTSSGIALWSSQTF